MNGRGDTIHPEIRTLALYASGDLRGLAAWRMDWHIRRCRQCGNEVTAFREANAELKRSAERQAVAAIGSLTNWNRLEREMAGNIAVGVAASRCIDRSVHKRVLISRGILAGLAAAVLCLAVWIVYFPMQNGQDLVASAGNASGNGTPAGRSTDTIIETTPEGITVQTPRARLTILHPSSAVISLARGPGVSARYIDEETGQVTITTVYGH